MNVTKDKMKHRQPCKEGQTVGYRTKQIKKK